MPKDSVLSIPLLPLIAFSYSQHYIVSDAFLTSPCATSRTGHQKKEKREKKKGISFVELWRLAIAFDSRGRNKGPQQKKRRGQAAFSEASDHLTAWPCISQHPAPLHPCPPFYLNATTMTASLLVWWLFFSSVQTTVCPSYSCSCVHRPSSLVLLKLCHALLALGHNPCLLPTITV